MQNARHYALALYELVSAHPERASQYLKNMRESLAHRGYEKLLPRIYSEYRKLQTGAMRAKKYQEVTPEMRRTRTLLELYQKLVASK